MKNVILVNFIIIIIQVVVQLLDLHHYNAYFDRFLWDTAEFFVLLIIVLLLLYLSQKITQPIIRKLNLLFPILGGLVCLIMFIKGCVLVVEGSNDYTQKMYFHSEGEWNYYARTWRRSALDELNIFIRKERDFCFGLYIDKNIDKNELNIVGFNYDEICEKYREYYFKLRKDN